MRNVKKSGRFLRCIRDNAGLSSKLAATWILFFSSVNFRHLGAMSDTIIIAIVGQFYRLIMIVIERFAHEGRR